LPEVRKRKQAAAASRMLLGSAYQTIRVKQMSSTLQSFVIALLTLLATGTTALADPVADEADAARNINAANTLLRAGKIGEAIESYRQVQPTDSHGDQLNYNLAVAHFRQGDIESAKSLFTAAAGSDSSLASRARYNLGNCYYSEALPQVAQDKDAAIDSLRAAISHYRGALRGNPSNVDARANIELAAQLLRKLEEEQQQEQEQQQDQQQSDQSEQSDQQQQNDGQQQDQSESQQSESQQSESQQSESQQSESQQSESQQSESQQSESQQSESQQSESEQSESGDSQSNQSKDQTSESEDAGSGAPSSPEQPQQQPTDPSAADQPSRKQSAQQQSPAGQPKQPEEDDDEANQQVPTGELTAADQQDADGQPAGAAGTAADAQQGVMSREEALKMLQAVRDRDMLRRIRREQLERARHVPVERDW
jgi:Ca-activated chloride channel family protein